ncbi:ABC transporter ATP-binding protein [Alkalicella caledoniensis]|uniref:ABC transporter ATP-binding protein n=1 Tax=Alkalicella caledoniensis TaxID=2731377 RepID=A0A7G9WDA5_ALKCA|nr:ABC transporter ATP-binding protein [Alkalicella caledoniensis]QNO16667.1 ABC transporter ATP-binding protein [Alkalicella caledoniensis]
MVLGGGTQRGHRGAPVVKARNTKKTLTTLWTYFEEQRKLLLLLLGVILISTGIGLWVPYLIGQAISILDGMDEGQGLTLLWLILLPLIAAYVVDAFIHVIQEWVMAGVSQKVVLKLRKSLFEKLQKLPISFFDVRTHGEIMSRLSNDIENVSGTIAQSTTQLMSSMLTITGSFVMMLILSPLLTLASVITIPLVYLVTKSIAKKTRLYFRHQQEHLGRLNGHIEEMVSGISVVKAFNQEEKVIKQFNEINNELCEVGIKAQVWSGFMMPLMNVIKNIGFTAVAAVGGILAVRGMIEIWIIASFIIYSRQFVRPLNEVATIFNTLQSAMAGAERVFEVMEEDEEPANKPKAETIKNPKGHITFDNVSFSYNTGEEVLKDISFEVKPGSSIALVGPTGAGKTTIVNLLTRFYDVNKGSILIDGKDIRDYTRDSLRESFGVVLQDTYLFSGTIKENIRYGRLEATDEEVKRAAVLARADVFIRRLPKGYDTMLSESGANLSQGQRQLLAIARAILVDPSILILDEATSNVDTRTELHIQAAMLELMKNRTSFIIAHRLSTIRDADIIMVIDNGRIVESGNHDYLIDKKGIYHKLYMSQFKNIAT